jgi:hypothetical protein
MRLAQPWHLNVLMQTDLATSSAPRSCPVHGPKGLALDFAERRWWFSCVNGPLDDVATPCECPHNEQWPSSGSLDLEARLDWPMEIVSSPEVEELSETDQDEAPEGAATSANMQEASFAPELAELAELAHHFDERMLPGVDIAEELEDLESIVRQYD